jgi:hypothetical protein
MFSNLRPDRWKHFIVHKRLLPFPDSEYVRVVSLTGLVPSSAIADPFDKAITTMLEAWRSYKYSRRFFHDAMQYLNRARGGADNAIECSVTGDVRYGEAHVDGEACFDPCTQRFSLFPHMLGRSDDVPHCN